MQKNVTLSADAALIARARKRAEAEKRTLNAAFRDWLGRYAGSGERAGDYLALMEQVAYARPGRHFDRDDANER